VAKDVRQREKRKSRLLQPGKRDVPMAGMIFLVFQLYRADTPKRKIKKIISANRGFSPQLTQTRNSY